MLSMEGQFNETDRVIMLGKKNQIPDQVINTGVERMENKQSSESFSAFDRIC